MCVCVYICLRVHIYTCVYIYIYIYMTYLKYSFDLLITKTPLTHRFRAAYALTRTLR